MLDPRVTEILDNAVNTSCKLAIVLMYLEHPTLCVSATEMAARVCRDIWSVEAALEELVEDGVLGRYDKRYICDVQHDLQTQLRLLYETYAHPLLRDKLQSRLRDLERYAPYRKELPRRFFETLVA